MPFLAFSVVLLGIGLTAQVGRKGMAVVFGLGLFLSILGYFGIKLGLALGHGGTINPYLSAWLPLSFFTVLGLFFFLRINRLR